MERNKKNTQLSLKKEIVETGEFGIIDIQQESMELQNMSIDTALAHSMLDANYIEIDDSNSGSNTTVNVGAKVGRDGLAVGIQVNRKKVINKRIVIHK